MPAQVILPSGCVAAVQTVIPDSFVDRVYVSLQVGFLGCFVITFRAGVSVYSVDLTDVLEQISFFISSVFTLIALEFFPLVDTFDVSL